MGDLKSIKAPSLRPTAAADCSLPATARSRVGHGLLSAAAGVMAVIFLGVKNMIINNASLALALALSLSLSLSLSNSSFCVCTVSEAVAVASLPLSPVRDSLPHPIDNGRWFASPLINSSIAIGINRLWIYLSPIYVIVVGNAGRGRPVGENGQLSSVSVCGACANRSKRNFRSYSS